MEDSEASASSPRGREQVREAILDAASELFAARGHQGTSMRSIAKEAGVNYGLLHRHFGSKSTLLRAVLNRLVERVRNELRFDESAQIEAVFQQTLEATRNHGAYFRILARAMLDGAQRDELQSNFPVAKRLVRMAQDAGIEEPRRFVAEQLAKGLGWLVFGPYLRAATGLDDEA